MHHRRHPTFFKTVLAALLAVMMMLLSAPSAWGSDPTPTPAPEPHPREKTFLKRRWGIEVEFVRLTAAGYMMEFRYRVLNAKKATALFEKKSKPLLTHDRTGAKFAVPAPSKTGALRNSNPPKNGKLYWVFFANPGNFVKAGDRVTIQIGPFRADNIVVE